MKNEGTQVVPDFPHYCPDYILIPDHTTAPTPLEPVAAVEGGGLTEEMMPNVVFTLFMCRKILSIKSLMNCIESCFILFSPSSSTVGKHVSNVRKVIEVVGHCNAVASTVVFLRRLSSFRY